MSKRSRFLVFLIALFVSNVPCLINASHSEQMQQEHEPSSFLLVASKQMPDPRFHEAVLLVTKHGNTGPIGVIVNRPQDVTLDKIFPTSPAAKEFSLFYGGPAYPKQISYLVRGGEAIEGALTISNNIYLAYDMPILGELLGGKRQYKNMRVMHGLASWAPGQLEYEIKLRSWYVLPFDEAIIFDHSPAGMWQELFNRANSVVL
jgi:putative transcriptional regulator